MVLRMIEIPPSDLRLKARTDELNAE
jgi:hypothetical protein